MFYLQTCYVPCSFIPPNSRRFKIFEPNCQYNSFRIKTNMIKNNENQFFLAVWPALNQSDFPSYNQMEITVEILSHSIRACEYIKNYHCVYSSRCAHSHLNFLYNITGYVKKADEIKNFDFSISFKFMLEKTNFEKAQLYKIVEAGSTI